MNESQPPGAASAGPATSIAADKRPYQWLRGGRAALERAALNAIMTGEDAGIALAMSLIERLEHRGQLALAFPSADPGDERQGDAAEDASEARQAPPAPCGDPGKVTEEGRAPCRKD